MFEGGLKLDVGPGGERADGQKYDTHEVLDIKFGVLENFT